MPRPEPPESPRADGILSIAGERRQPAAGSGRRALRALARVGLALAALLVPCSPARAQAIEPRQFSNAPIGFNFLLVGFAHSSGGVALDPSVPIQDASIDIDSPFVAYVRSVGIGTQSAKIQVLVPYAWLYGEGLIGDQGEFRTREVDGFGDPAVRLSVNLHGAPALSPAEFAGYRQDLIVGASLMVTAPLGQYDPTRLVNIGTNRWSFRPEIGFAKAVGPWIFEGSGAVTFYTDNDEFYGGQHREQDPVYALQGHVIRDLPRGAWTALDVTWYRGGRTTVDDVQGDDLQRNWRAGLTLALPINRRHSIKFYVSNGVSTRVGDDVLVFGAGWQYRWGRGMKREVTP